MAKTTLKAIAPDGKKLTSVDVDSSSFVDTVNEHLVYLAVKREQLNKRAPSAFALTRAEVSGGGKKPWKQKGTGRARVGSIRSPLWVGGGRSFGPRSQSFSLKLNKKERQSAIRSILTLRKDALFVCDEFAFIEKPSTKAFKSFLVAHDLSDKKVALILSGDSSSFVEMSARNLPNVTVSTEHSFSYSSLLNADAIIAPQSFISRYQKA